MDDYISRAELLKEINLATWDTEGDRAEAHYIATQIEPAVISINKNKEMAEAIKKQGVIYSNIPADVIPVSVLQEVKWIPVKERLPEEKNEKYWICTDTGYQCECRWTNANRFWPQLKTDWHWNIVDIPQYSEVVAWMPLPEPYKEDE